jgi:1-acyl-sn-glycerol-3-phosphate acyltransferase
MANVLAYLRRAWIVYFFFVAILAINVLLFGAMLLALVGLLSDRSYRELANFCTGSSWCLYPQCFEEEAGGKVAVYGCELPKTNRVLVMANHVEAPDWSIVFWLACAAGHLAHLKVFAKKSISYIPLIGTGMRAMGQVFLSRNWERDKKSIMQTFAHLRDSNLPFWLMTHPEGTRVTPAKIAESQAFAASKGLPRLENVLLPRTKGLLATFAGLDKSLESVLDVTLVWSERPGPLPFFFFGQGGSRTVYVYLREFPLSSIPVKDEAKLLEWLYARWQEKDKLIGQFRRTGSFGSKALKVSLPHNQITADLRVWQAVVVAISALMVLQWLL